MNLEIELAEAAEAFAVVADFRVAIDGASARIERLLEVFGSPMRAGSQTRRTVRHWWARAREFGHQTNIVP